MYCAAYGLDDFANVLNQRYWNAFLFPLRPFLLSVRNTCIETKAPVSVRTLSASLKKRKEDFNSIGHCQSSSHRPPAPLKFWEKKKQPMQQSSGWTLGGHCLERSSLGLSICLLQCVNVSINMKPVIKHKKCRIREITQPLEVCR